VICRRVFFRAPHRHLLFLLQAARDLTAAINDLLRASQPNSGESRQNLLAAAGKVGDASHDILKYIGEGADDGFQVSGEAA